MSEPGPDYTGPINTEECPETECDMVLPLPPILIVDDNDFNSFSLQELIRQNFGLESDIAVHGLQALTKVKERILAHGI